MKNQTNETIRNEVTERAQRVAEVMCDRLDELCDGTPENEFDVWCRRRLYPVLALYDVMPFGVDRKMYERRLEELCEGKPENEFDKWLRERFYPILAIFIGATERIFMDYEPPLMILLSV